MVVGQKKMVPDSNGGWYMLKQNGRWNPVQVAPASAGRSASVEINSQIIEVKDVVGEWGRQISHTKK